MLVQKFHVLNLKHIHLHRRSMMQTLISRTLEMPQKDSVLQDLIQFILDIWQDQKCEVSDHITPFFNFHDGILLNGNRIIILKHWKEVLQQLHIGYVGIAKCQLVARGSVNRPQINKDIKLIVKQCAPCLIMKKN